MTIAFTITDNAGAIRQESVETGETLALNEGERAELSDIARSDVSLSLGEGDVLSLSAGGDTVLVSGLVEHLEDETGGGLLFSDGVEIDSLGQLLEAVGGAAVEGDMADLVADSDAEADSTDVVYLYLDGAAATSPSEPILHIAELLESGDEAALLESVAGNVAEGRPAAGWAATESQGFGGFSGVPGDGDEDGLLIPPITDIV
jgi:hypothetical protein